MLERKDVFTIKGNPVTLVGPELKPGDRAPEFELRTPTGMVRLGDSKGQVRLLSVVPAIDTGVCTAQTKKFNDQLANLAGKLKPYTISVDLPPSQNRFCGENDIANMETLSDHFDLNFGDAYGLHIKEKRQLARAVIVVDRNDKIAYFQLVPEMAQEPDYDEAMAALKRAIG